MSASPIELLLGALEQHGSKVNRLGPRSWEAQCPAHDDHKASLSITEADDGTVLLKCHRGCPTEDVLAALGLSFSDLYPARESRGESVVATYDYRTASGELVYQVVRYAPKSFRQRVPDGRGGWTWSLRDLPAEERALPYKLPEIAKAVANGKARVAIVEGEKDVEALWALGVPATTNAAGAGKWTAAHARRLAEVGVRGVKVLADRDEPGKAHAAQVARICRQAGLEVVGGGFYVAACEDGCKDASDLALKHGSNTREWPLELVEVTDEAPEADKPTGLPVIAATSLRMEATKWLWADRLPLGAVSLLVGREGVGKSTLAMDIAARLSVGKLEGHPDPAGTLVVSFEDDAARTLLPRFLAAGGDPRRLWFLSMLTLPKDVRRLDAVVGELGVRLLIMDPLSAALGSGGVDTHRDADVRAVLAHLQDLAQRRKAGILCLAHWNKGMSSEPLDRVLGSRAFTAASRSVLALGKTEDGLVLAQLKSNLAEEAGSLALRITSSDVDDGNGGRIPTSRIEWLGPSDVGARELLRGPSHERGEKRGAAEEWLESYLKDGPMPASEVEAAAKAEGISPRTLRRARRGLGVVARKVGTAWLLSLPEEGGQEEGGQLGPLGRLDRKTRSDQGFQGGQEEGGQLLVGPLPCGPLEGVYLPETIPERFRDAPAVKYAKTIADIDPARAWPEFLARYTESPWSKDLSGAWADWVLKRAAGARVADLPGPTPAEVEWGEE